MRREQFLGIITFICAFFTIGYLYGIFGSYHGDTESIKMLLLIVIAIQFASIVYFTVLLKERFNAKE